MSSDPARSQIVDLRQYTLVPGRRHQLINMFDRLFVAGQEAAGMHVLGQFEDLDDPDRFVWLRGFDSMPARRSGLESFYGGPGWLDHREAANATMRDSDDALLLTPVQLGSAYPRFGAREPVPGPAGVIGIDVAYLDVPVGEPHRLLAARVGQALTRAGAALVAVYETKYEPNNFPPLPLRDENVLAWVTRTPDQAAHAAVRHHLASEPAWSELQLLEQQAARLPFQHLRLHPTPGSQLR